MAKAHHVTPGRLRADWVPAVTTAGTARVFTSTNRSNRAMRALLGAEGWSFSGQLDGLDEGDPELVFYQDRPARPGPHPAE